MDDLHKFFCPNKKCSQYGIRGAENIRVKDTYGPTTPDCSNAERANNVFPNAEERSFSIPDSHPTPLSRSSNMSLKATECEKQVA